MARWTDWVIGLCLGLFVAGGRYLLYLGLRNVWLSWASQSWPVTAGLVSESSTGSTVSRDSKTGARSTMYEAKLAFSYQAGGAQHETGNLYFGQTVASGDSSEAELLHLRYPVGAQVRISYNPKDPPQAVLMPGFHADVLWLPGAGLAFAVTGAMFLIMYFSSQYKASGMSMGVALFAAIFGLAGAAMLAAGGRNLWLAHASRTWPAAAGEIVYSVGESSESVSTNDEGYRTVSETYSTRVVYKYLSGGATRYGNIRRFGQISGSSAEWAAEIAGRYPKGRAVKVAYRPGDEDTAVLEPGINSDAWWIPGIGLACLLFALAAAIFVVPAIGNDPGMPQSFPLSGRRGSAGLPRC